MSQQNLISPGIRSHEGTTARPATSRHTEPQNQRRPLRHRLPVLSEHAKPAPAAFTQKTQKACRCVYQNAAHGMLHKSHPNAVRPSNGSQKTVNVLRFAQSMQGGDSRTESTRPSSPGETTASHAVSSDPTAMDALVAKR